MTIVEPQLFRKYRYFSDMRVKNRSFLNVYNPANQTKSEIIDNFVVRLHEFETIFSAIKRKDLKNYLVQGPRGSGKTTLLLRLFYEIQNYQDLSHSIIPIRFDEDGSVESYS